MPVQDPSDYAGLLRLEGRCTASFAFDIGDDIDLDRCEQLLGETERQTVRARRRVPPHFDYRPAPLRLAAGPPPLAEPAGFAPDRVDIVLYDFGGAAVNYGIPFRTTPDRLADLAVALEAEPTLVADARQRLRQLLDQLGSAVSHPRVSAPVEDYFLFEVAHLWRGGVAAPPTVLLDEGAAATARLLRASPDPLSASEIEDALRLRYTFAPSDLTLVDWNAAILCDPFPEETRVLLEFANVQLVQLRHLDGELDRVVDTAYEALASADRGLLRRLRPPTAGFRRLGELQMESAIVFERVTNAVKLAGDQFLSRVYGGATERFHFSAWDRAISRKLEVIDGIYQKLSDRVMARRLEVLEWIIIVLIALSVALPLLG